MAYKLTERGEPVAFQLGALLVLSGYGRKPVDIPSDLGISPGTQFWSAVGVAKDLGYITEREKPVRGPNGTLWRRQALIYFTRSGVKPVSLLYAIWTASRRDHYLPTEYFVQVSELEIIRYINLLAHLDSDIQGLMSSLIGGEAPPPVSMPIPFRKNLQNLIDAGLLEQV